MPNSEQRSGVPTTLAELHFIIGDLIEAIDQLDMARESGGVISADVINRLRSHMAKRAHRSTQGAR